MRLFIAIAVSDEIRLRLAALIKELRNAAPGAKWVRAENLHVTLKFLGETNPAQLDRMPAVLKAIRSPKPVGLTFRGLGFFPNEQRPRVFWAGMEGSENLKTLARDIDRAVHDLGFALEEKPFTPHLTLARLNPPGLPRDLATMVKQQTSKTFGSLNATEFHLIESKLKPGGAEYTTLQSFPFVAEI